MLIIQGVLEYVGTTSLVDLTLQNKKKAHINMARYDLVSMIQLYLYYINYLPGFTEIAQNNHFWHEYKLIDVSAQHSARPYIKYVSAISVFV